MRPAQPLALPALALALAAACYDGAAPDEAMHDGFGQEGDEFSDDEGDALAKKASLAPRSTPFESGAGYPFYRSPTIIKASNGHLLAFAEGRDREADDCQSDIVLRRSTDDGNTWLKEQVIATDGTNRLSYPVPIALDDGEVILLYNKSKFVKHEQDRGCFDFVMRRSTDNGKTWSAKLDITDQVSLPCREDANGVAVDPPAPGKWGYSWLGGAHGVVKTIAPHVGRIVVGARHSDSDGKTRSHVIYSDDRGATWRIGGSLDRKSTECTVVELDDGRIMLNARSNNASVNRRTVAVSADGGKSFGPAWFEDELPEPSGCQGSLLRFGSDILFSNPASAAGRTNGSIRRSPDGHDWGHERVRYTGDSEFSGYSDLVRVKGGVGILAEWGADHTAKVTHQEIRFFYVPKEDLGL